MIRNLLFICLACTSISFAKGTWEEQQARAEEISAEHQAKYPNLSSEKIVFKTVELPDGSKLDLDFRIVRPKEGGPFPVVFFVHGGAWATGSKAFNGLALVIIRSKNGEAGPITLTAESEGLAGASITISTKL